MCSFAFKIKWAEVVVLSSLVSAECPQKSQDFSAVEKIGQVIAEVQLFLNAANRSQTSATDTKELKMARIKTGDKVIPDTATANHGNVRIGDYAPTFIQAGDKVVRDNATLNGGKVHIGDYAPAFRAGAKVIRDNATVNHGKVQLGDYAPAFSR
jgi:fructose-specific component phosphotransferase system IIB-like protein